MEGRPGTVAAGPPAGGPGGDWATPGAAPAPAEDGKLRFVKQAPTVSYGAYAGASEENARYYSVDWMRENVSTKGPLGAFVRVWGDGKQMVKDDIMDYFGLSGYTADELRAKGYAVWTPPRPKGEFLGEGDTFTYLNLVANGARRLGGAWLGERGPPGAPCGRHVDGRPRPTTDNAATDA